MHLGNSLQAASEAHRHFSIERDQPRASKTEIAAKIHVGDPVSYRSAIVAPAARHAMPMGTGGQT